MGIVEVIEEKPEEGETFDIAVTTSSAVWRDILSKDKSAIATNITGGIKCEPSIIRLGSFMKYFETIVDL